MELIPTNTGIFSPRGFRPRVADPRSTVEVAAGTVWGRDDVARLRQAGLVRVTPRAGSGREDPGGGLGPDDLAVRTVLWLALAGVPVTGVTLAPAVRTRLDDALLALLDRVTPDSVSDPGSREQLSLGLRRRAREMVVLRPHRTRRPVLVLLPEGADDAPTLLADLATQTWPAVLHHLAAGEAAAGDVFARAREVDAPWCTRVRADVRYGPHHLADLVDALGHSGAAAAHSPLRFRPWRHGTWLEDDRLGVEGPAAGGLEGGSLWYADDGPLSPVRAQGYAVHGANAVPAVPVVGSEAVALRLCEQRPTVLDWLAPAPTRDPLPGSGQRGAVPPSYFAGTPSRARNATTDSES